MDFSTIPRKCFRARGKRVTQNRCFELIDKFFIYPAVFLVPRTKKKYPPKRKKRDTHKRICARNNSLTEFAQFLGISLSSNRKRKSPGRKIEGVFPPTTFFGIFLSLFCETLKELQCLGMNWWNVVPLCRWILRPSSPSNKKTEEKDRDWWYLSTLLIEFYRKLHFRAKFIQDKVWEKPLNHSIPQTFPNHLNGKCIWERKNCCNIPPREFQMVFCNVLCGGIPQILNAKRIYLI